MAQPIPFASDMRKHTQKTALSGMSPVIAAAVEVIVQRIHERSSLGCFDLYYPFDGICRHTGRVEGQALDGLTADQIRVLVDLFTKRGYTYQFNATQDPGNPNDRALHVLKWR